MFSDEVHNTTQLNSVVSYQKAAHGAGIMDR